MFSDFPLTADEYEDAVNEQIGQAEAQEDRLQTTTPTNLCLT